VNEIEETVLQPRLPRPCTHCLDPACGRGGSGFWPGVSPSSHFGRERVYKPAASLITPIGISRTPIAVNSFVEKPCFHGPDRHSSRDLARSGRSPLIIGRRLRRYLSAPSPEKRLLPFHRAALGFAQVSSPGGDGCGRPRCGRCVHSGTGISNPACSSGESRELADLRIAGG
jgi:hypothetical protein